MHPIHVVALTMLVANLLLPVSGDRAIAQSSAVDACGLFTLEEAGKAVGYVLRRARPGKEAEGTTCSLNGGPDGNIGVTLSPSPSKRNFDDLRKLLTEQGEKPETVTGVGEDAYYWGTRIYVRARNQLLVITYPESKQSEARARALVLALAKLGVTKLK